MTLYVVKLRRPMCGAYGVIHRQGGACKRGLNAPLKKSPPEEKMA